MHPRNLIELGPDDVDRIAALERAAFSPPCQASAETLRARFANGHRMIGIVEEDELVALIGYFYTQLVPTSRSISCLPATEQEFCLTPNLDDGNAVVVYNLEVSPRQRGLAYPQLLLQQVLREAKDRGGVHSFGTSRAPSYAGSDPRFPQETFACQPDFRAAIDRYFDGGEFPTQAEFQLDPVLSLYHQLTGCTCLAVLRNYAPGDTASGGLRVLVYRSLADWP